MNTRLSIIIPAYNDSTGLQSLLPELITVCRKKKWRIIIVNDCSTDNTAAVISAFSKDISVINNEKNIGYGGSLKTGILAAETEWIATMDADGQHRVEDLKGLASLISNSKDAILGMRTRNSHAPYNRRFGKWWLQRAFKFITGKKIPDINCGLRIMRREIMLRLFSVTSDRFSFSTSTTVCLLQLGCRVEFSSVKIEKRIGKSHVKQFRDGFYTLLLIVRLIVLFKPLRIMLPAAIMCFGFALINQMITFFNRGLDISDATVLLALTGLILSFMALVSDQVSGLRRDMLLHDIKLEQLRQNFCYPNDER